jgi:D-alanyl-D-alanine carboxypeptidase
MLTISCPSDKGGKVVRKCRAWGDESAMMSGTKRHLVQARARTVRGRRDLPRPGLRAPFGATLLSLLMLLSPDLTMAPIMAGEPVARAPRPLPLLAEDMWVLPRVLTQPPVDHRTAGPVIPDVDAPPATSFQDALDAARTAAAAYGVTFAVVRDGQVVWAGSSGRERDCCASLTPESTMVIGSVTKTYVAATVLQLAEEGVLALDDTVRAHLPELRMVSRTITINQLLNHTSGLADLFNDETRAGIEQHPERAWTTPEVLNSLHAPWYLPGQAYAYANTNYMLLGLIVERLTGNTLADEIDGRFLAPLDLYATRMLSASEPDGPLEPAWASIFWASGAMSSSAVDLARWGDALYGDGILADDTKREMLRIPDDDDNYGLGVQRIELPRRVGYGHTGLLNTYTTLLLHLPADNVTIAMLVNRTQVDLRGMLMERPGEDGPSLLRLATTR